MKEDICITLRGSLVGTVTNFSPFKATKVLPDR